MAKKPPPRSDIQIRLSHDELRRLLHMVYIASWVMGAHKTEEDPRVAPYEALEQKLYGLAARHGFAGESDNPDDDLIDYAEELKKYYPTIYLDESEVRDFLDEYDDDSFWDELTFRLAERDAIREVGGVEQYAELSPIERITRTGHFESLYGDEFYEHGLNNVRIVRPPAPPRTLH